MIATRIAKLVMVASLAGFAFIVTFDNVTDYAANYAFVQHVLAMDTIFPDSPLMYRAITSPVALQLAYGAIIAAEGVTCMLFAIGAVSLARALFAEAAVFERAKRFTVLGATLAFLVWFTGFMVIGGEWFAMWQSKLWNGPEAAFRFYMTVLVVLVFVNQPDRELGQE